MFFLIDPKLKILIGWSAKCGCSHIKKIFWYLQNDNMDNNIHIIDENNTLPDDITNYTSILIIRNPYERIVSGFLDKYKLSGDYRYLWKNTNITFSSFVDEIVKKNWSVIEPHHFTPQTTEKFDKNKLLKSKKLILYDITNIDYEYIENLYNKKIPEKLINFRGGHQRKKYNEIFHKPVYDLNMELYEKCDVPVNYFYNDIIKEEIKNFYINDFLFFEENGFNYKMV
jgi:hypothetical protein